MPTSRHGTTLCVLPEPPSFLILGGSQVSNIYAGPEPQSTAERFVPADDSWESMDSMPDARYAAAKGYGLVTVQGGSTRAYVLGGSTEEGYDMTARVEVFDLL